MAVTEGRILDLLADACARYRREGERGAQWTLCYMTVDERLAFDLFLVRTKDPLAWEAGTVTHRWVTRVRRMVMGLRCEGPLACDGQHCAHAAQGQRCCWCGAAC